MAKSLCKPWSWNGTTRESTLFMVGNVSRLLVTGNFDLHHVKTENVWPVDRFHHTSPLPLSIPPLFSAMDTNAPELDAAYSLLQPYLVQQVSIPMCSSVVSK